MRLYCPQNLDLERVLQEQADGRWQRHLRKLYYVMTLVYRARWNKEFEKDDFVPLNAKVLRAVLGTRFARPAVERLMQLGIIETDRHYVVGRKSRGYRFKDPYRDIKFRQVDKVESWILPSHSNSTFQTKSENFARAFLYENLKRITFAEEVDSFILNFDFEAEWQRDLFERTIADIRENEWFFSTSPKTGRVFNNITNLPKELRPFLRLNGRPLVEVDVTNSQPFLLLELYDDEPEKSQYTNLVVGGHFYETLDAALEKPYGADKRDKLKQRVFTQVFFDRLRIEQGKVCQAFANSFPVLYSKIIAMKQRDYRDLALRLQSAEASIIIDAFVAEVSETSKYPLLTIHDAVLTFEEHVEAVQESLRNIFQRRFGLVPQFKVKRNELGVARNSLAA